MSRAQGISKFTRILYSFLFLNLLCDLTHSSTEQPEGLTEQILIPEGHFYFGTQMQIDDRFMVYNPKDGGKPRKKKFVKAFSMDIDCVTNAQFKLFVEETGYETEAEKFKWSFVLEQLASAEAIEEADSGLGRVQNAKEWLAVKNANWKHPHGPDTSVRDFLNYPVVQVSYNDAVAYCKWAHRKLPTEVEWEYAARGGFVNQSYPWGDSFEYNRLNIWEGKFPKENILSDGFLGSAPVRSFEPNPFGLYNMVGNVWEWVRGGKPSNRVLRGASFIDSKDGSFHHAAMVSTRQINRYALEYFSIIDILILKKSIIL